MTLQIRKVSDLRVWRVSLGLTQAEIAQRVGCTQRTVSHLECGSMSHGGRVLHEIVRVLTELQQDHARL
jgi:predicted transcriptional regulator